MLKKIPADRRHSRDLGWLKTHWLFSFSDYRDPENTEWGALRVFNDDVVAPGSGFPTHFHRDYEILTIILDGELTHEDTSGGKEVIRAGQAQHMSTGTGIAHSEFNLSDQPTHLYQIWIRPAVTGGSPGYETASIPGDDRRNRLQLVAGNTQDSPLPLRADACIYLSRIEKGHEVDYSPATDERHLFIYVTKGTVRVNGEELAVNDQARLSGEEEVRIEAEEEADLILIDAA